MSQPPYPYNRIFDFESFSINTPAAQQPGVQLEGEYDAIKRTIDSLISRLAEIQRDDGKLRGEAFDITTASSVYLEILALLQPALALKANLASPALTGTPTAPTPATNSNNTAIATTAFVKAQGYATTTSLNNAIDGVESLVDAVDARVDATNEEVSHKLDKRTGGSVLEDVTLNKKLHVYGYSPEIIVQSTNSANGIANLTNSFIQFLSGYNNDYSLINSGLIGLAKQTVGFAQLQPNKISVSNQFGASSVELSSAGLKFLDGTLQSTAFTPADYATNTSVDTKIANLVDSAPATLNTLNEIAAALGDDANLATTLTNSIATKMPLNGGVLTGQLQVAAAGLKNALNENFIIDAYNDDAAGTHNLFKFNPFGGGLELPTNSAGIKFGDGTTQVTAGLPLTGGTVTGQLTLGGGGSDALYINNSGGITIKSDDNWDIQMGGGNIQGFAVNPDTGIPYSVYQLAVDGKQFNITNFTEDDYSKPNHCYVEGNGILVDSYDGETRLGDSRLRFNKLEFVNGLNSGNPSNNVGVGSFDSGRGGYNGISLNCAAGYELNWQAGYLKALNSGGFVVPINVDQSSIIVSGLPDIDDLSFTTTLSAGVVNVSSSQDGSASFDVGGIGGTTNGGPNWGLGVSGAGGDNDDDSNWGIGYNGAGGSTQNSIWAINGNIVSGEYEDSGFETKTWSLGENGLKFIDGTIQTTAALGLTGGTVTGQTVFSLGGQNEFDNFQIKDANPTNPWNFIVSPYEQYMSVGNSNGNRLNYDAGILEITSSTYQAPLNLGVKTGLTNSHAGDVAVLTQGFVWHDGVSVKTAAALSGATFTGKVSISAGATIAPLNIGTGVNPTTPLAGDVWIVSDSLNYRNTTGTTRVVATMGNNNAFTNYQSISVSNNSNPALKITQLGSGEALRVEDETSPDATAFVVSNNGRAGIGVAPDATVALSVDATGIKVNGMVIVPATTVTNSFYPSGTMHHDQYTKELIVTLGGVQYGIPLRVV